MHTAAEAAGKGHDAGQDHDLTVGASVGHEAGLALADDATLIDELSELAVDSRVEHASQDRQGGDGSVLQRVRGGLVRFGNKAGLPALEGGACCCCC